MSWWMFWWSLLTSAVALAALLAVTLAVALRVGRHSVIDVAWGLGFTLVALVSYLLSGSSGGDPARRLLVLGLTAAWGMRLALHIGGATSARARTRATSGCSAAPPAAAPCTRSARST
jgi:steroid 5-alpha reductase family enzyme